MKRLEEISLDQIIPDPEQAREFFDQSELEELADSIRENGVLQPIEVTRVGENLYMIHFGERRWRAAKMAGLKSILAIVAPPTDELVRLVHGFVENAQRADLNVIERGMLFERLMQMGLSKQEIVRRTGKRANYINDTLLWRSMEEDIQMLVLKRHLPTQPRVAKALLSIPDSTARVQLAKALASDPPPATASIEKACSQLIESLEQKKAETLIQQKREKQVPMAELAEKDRQHHPDRATVISLKNVRAAARSMCEKCYLSSKAGVVEPAWALLSQAAQVTCRNCQVFLQGTPSLICRECPGVTMLKNVMLLLQEEITHE